MAIDLQSMTEEILTHGAVTLQPLFPKEWKNTTRVLLLTLPEYPGESSIEVFIPSELPPRFKENLSGLIQETCYRHGFSALTITELGE